LYFGFAGMSASHTASTDAGSRFHKFLTVYD
jgi:hypothetical protein